MSFGGYEKGKQMTRAYNKGKEETVEDVLKYPIAAISDRNIDKATAERFGVRTKYNEATGEVAAHYFPYYFENKLVGFKKRDLTVPKISKDHFSVVGTQGPKCDLFGLNVANKTGGKKVFITEGEYDCLVVWQTLKQRYPKANPTVLSISSGTANAVANLGQKQNQSYLSKFAEVVVVFDNDRATPAEREKKIVKGQDAVAAVYNLMPDIRVATLPDNEDPCDMVKQGLEEQLYWACMKPVPFKPDGFVTYDSFRDKALELPKLGRPWPWPKMTKLSLGRRLGEGHYIGAGVKIGKCFSAGTKVRMFDGSVKPVESIVVGDKVMGVDSTPRIVVSCHSGRDIMYEVKQTYGKNYTTNGEHTLVLRDSGNNQKEIQRTVKDLHNSYGDCNPLRDLKGFHVGVDYPVRDDFEVDPYTFGVWLGDGSQSDSRVTLNLEDAQYIVPKCSKISFFDSSKEGCYEGTILDRSSFFKSFGGIKNIPEKYLLSSKKQRLELLAGWIDTDGYKRADNGYEIVTKEYLMALQGQSLLRSLGFKVTVRQITKKIKSTGFEGTYFSITFSGDLRDCPIQVPRKVCKTAPKKEPTNTPIKILEVGEGNYFGFEIDGDHKFLLEDYTVVHNSEFVNKLAEHIMKVENNKLALFKFEEEPDITCKKIAGKMYKKDFTNPEKVIFISEQGEEVDIYGNTIRHKEYGFFTPEELAEAVDSVGDNVIYYNNYGSCSWESVKGAIRHAVLVEGVQDIVLDPISRLVQGMPAADANTVLEGFADDISKMSKDLGFTYYCFCHLKAPTQGPPHERGGAVQSYQFTGSRAMMRACYYMWGLERNKDPDLPDKERNTTKVVLLEDRKYGRAGYFHLYYDSDTGDYVEPPEGFLESSIDSLCEYREQLQNGTF